MWLTLEDGVQVRFQPAESVQSPPDPNAAKNEYVTGDYLLIPARTATGDVEWPKVADAQGNPATDPQGNIIPAALPPHGVTHYRAPLAVINVTGNEVVVANDCRGAFRSVVDLTQV